MLATEFVYDPVCDVGVLYLCVVMLGFFIGMYHRSSCRFCTPCKITSLFLTTLSFFFVKTTVHQSSHICPSESRDALFKFGSISACCAALDNFFVSGTCPDPCDRNMELSGC